MQTNIFTVWSISYNADYGVEVSSVFSQDGDKCIFRGNDGQEGSFTSPNTGGLYPRNTECQYMMYCGSDQNIQLNFTYVDVEGIPPR